MLDLLGIAGGTLLAARNDLPERCAWLTGNRLSRSLTALTLFAFAGKIGIAIDLVHLHVSFAHPLTRFVGGRVQALPVQILGVRDTVRKRMGRAAPKDEGPRPPARSRPAARRSLH